LKVGYQQEGKQHHLWPNESVHRRVKINKKPEVEDESESRSFTSEPDQSKKSVPIVNLQERVVLVARLVSILETSHWGGNDDEGFASDRRLAGSC